MSISKAPRSAQESAPFEVDQKLAQSLAERLLEPYKKVATLLANSPEKREAYLSQFEGKVREAVEEVLAMTHQTKVKEAAIADLANAFSSVMHELEQKDNFRESLESQLKMVRYSIDAKLAATQSQRLEEEKLPPYFKEWVDATTAAVIRIIQQTIDGVN